MLRRYLFLFVGLLIAVVLTSTLPTVTQAQQQGGENFIFINYFGQEMVFDLDDVTYIIPGTSTAPEGGRLALQLAPGEHKYAANVPGIPTGSAGEFTIEPGGVVAKAARVEQTSPQVRDGILIKKPEDYVYVFDFDPFAPSVASTPMVDTWQPTAAAPGVGSVVWINYSGADELTVDLAGELYKVPLEANGIPGRLQVDVPAGFYRYTASVPNGSLNGEVTVIAGQVIGLNIIPGLREAPEYDIGDEFHPLTKVDLNLYEENLTALASTSQPEPAPAALPTTGGEMDPVAVVPVARPEGLLIKNYAGDALVFTINGQTYTLVNDAEQTLDLPAGVYHYTASLPFVATTGTVNLGTGKSVELSIAINVEHNLLSVYQN
jgi:hypothetical protein